jgi:hypothetical protein
MIGITAIRSPTDMQAALLSRAAQNLSERPAYYVVSPSELVRRAKEIQQTAAEANQKAIARIGKVDVSA